MIQNSLKSTLCTFMLRNNWCILFNTSSSSERVLSLCFVSLDVVSHHNWAWSPCRNRQKLWAGPARSPETGLSPADRTQQESAQTGMPRRAGLPEEELPHQTPHTWHITASSPHRRLGLKTQAGSCWLKIHLCLLWFMHVSLSQERKGEEWRTASLVHIVRLCVGTASLPRWCLRVCGWQVGNS